MQLQPGNAAPQITAINQVGEHVSLTDFIGKKVVLYFYPKDNTPTCTTEACNLRDNFDALKKAGIIVLGVSTDNEKSHKKFQDKLGLPFMLLADEDQKIVNDFGVWAEKKLWGKTYMGILRTTFLINEQGVIDHIIEKVDSKNHTAQILKTWGLG